MILSNTVRTLSRTFKLFLAWYLVIAVIWFGVGCLTFVLSIPSTKGSDTYNAMSGISMTMSAAALAMCTAMLDCDSNFIATLGIVVNLASYTVAGIALANAKNADQGLSNHLGFVATVISVVCTVLVSVFPPLFTDRVRVKKSMFHLEG